MSDDLVRDGAVINLDLSGDAIRWAELTALRAERDALAAQLATVTAQRDAMWKVVDQAVAWRAAVGGETRLMQVIAEYIEKVSPDAQP